MDMKVLFEIDEASEMLLSTGYRKALSRLSLEDKANIRAALLDYHCMLKVKAEMDQFGEGLADAGVLQYVKQYPGIMKPLFTCDEYKPVSAGKYKK